MDKEASMGWRRSRYAVLLAVTALHALLLAVLVLRREGIRLASPGKPLEISFLAPNRTHDKVALPPLQTSRQSRAEPKIDVPTIVLLPPQSNEPGLPSVNWAAEATRAAESAARNAISAQPKTFGSTPPGSSDWFPLPKHHAGDEEPVGGGDTAVYINENCYQIAPVIPPIIDALHNGMGVQTYCKDGRSKEPRGDLFKDLEAYKKLHPDK
jgi:hypothetical protein